MWFYFSLVISLVLLLADQFLKFWVKSHLTGGYLVLIPHVLSLTNVQNNGAAWNLLTGRRDLLIGLAVLALGILICYLWRCRFDCQYALTLSLLISGALGNLFSRLFSGTVVDMFCLTFVDFPVFNVADVCLTIGVVALSWLIFTDHSASGGPK